MAVYTRWTKVQDASIEIGCGRQPSTRITPEFFFFFFFFLYHRHRLHRKFFFFFFFFFFFYGYGGGNAEPATDYGESMGASSCRI